VIAISSNTTTIYVGRAAMEGLTRHNVQAGRRHACQNDLDPPEPAAASLRARLNVAVRGQLLGLKNGKVACGPANLA
jgi:hypothetical protein